MTTVHPNTNPNNVTVDGKLFHIVKRLWNQVIVNDTSSSSSVSDESKKIKLQSLVLERHREYRRRNSTWFQFNFDACMTQLLQQQQHNKKRQRDEESEEDEYDQLRQSIMEQSGSGSMLNAGLRDRYKEVQRERDNSASTNNNTSHKTNNHQEVLPSIAEDATSVTPKKKKKKKSLSRSASSNSLLITENKGDGLLGWTERPSERYSDLGGMEKIVKEIQELVDVTLLHPEIFHHLGVHPPRGVLLRGPPGCGKTHLANAIAGSIGCPYFRVSAPELVSSMSGDSEERIRQLFAAASANAPSLIFMDEMDAIAPKRSNDGNSRGMEKRIVAQLLTSMDTQVHPKNNRNQAPVMIIGATNRPDSIDTALRRAGRFDREITLSVPDETARRSILQRITSNMRIAPDTIDYHTLAKQTPGYVGADLQSLTKQAAILAMNRIFSTLTQNDQKKEEDVHTVVPFQKDQLKDMYLTMDDFTKALDQVQPSAQREGFAMVPDVSWEDVGALQGVREELTLHVLEPIRHPEKFEALGLPLPAGVLLYGPPGCGKTLLAKAIAQESGSNFISVKGPELLDKYVGESERAVRTVFDRARMSSPCVVFFDELDSLCPKRGSDNGGGGVSERVVNQLLTEMDGLNTRQSVFVVAATNRPELIDPAMLRPYVIYTHNKQTFSSLFFIALNFLFFNRSFILSFLWKMNGIQWEVG